MAVTTPAAFDPVPRRLGTTGNFIVTAAVLEGQIVAFHGTGVDWSVGPASTTGAYTGAPLGVALYTQAIVGGKVAVAMFGSVVKVCNATASTILAGVQVHHRQFFPIPKLTAPVYGSSGTLRLVGQKMKPWWISMATPMKL